MDVIQAIGSDLARGLIGDNFIVFALAALGLNIHFGYTGLLNFGQAVYMAAGAFGLAVTVKTLELPGGFWTGVAMGLVVFPAILTLIMGIPTLRLRADYLAIVTIAVSEMFRYIARSPKLDSVTGASDGLTDFAGGFYKYNPFSSGGRYFFGLFTGNQAFIVMVGWTLVAVVTVAIWLLIRSPWGRVLKAIREDEDAALALGKNAFSYKMQALFLGGVCGGLAGLVMATATQSAQPDNFVTDITFFAWVALILGGAGRVAAPIIGSALLWGAINLTDSVLRQGTSRGVIPDWLMSGTQVGVVRYALIGVALILLAAFRPQGIFGNKEEMALDDR